MKNDSAFLRLKSCVPKYKVWPLLLLASFTLSGQYLGAAPSYRGSNHGGSSTQLPNLEKSTDEDTALQITLPSGNVRPGRYVVTGALYGTTSINGNVLTYTPNANSTASESLSYYATDPRGKSTNTATIKITINPVNDPPVGSAQSLSLIDASTLDLVLSGTDVDSSNLTYSIVDSPVHGTISSGDSAGRTYTLTDAGYNGDDSFSYSVSDGALVSDTATVTISISQTAVSESGDYCEAELDAYCAPLSTSDWQTWCRAQGFEASSVAIDPCANQKYARDSCIEDAIADGKEVSASCKTYMEDLNSANDALTTECLYTTEPGGVCVGVMPTPAPADWNSETQGEWVDPFVGCLLANFESLTAACQEAVTTHEAIKR